MTTNKYALPTGQFPLVGDVVANNDRRVGTVRHIIHYGAGPAELVIEWEEKRQVFGTEITKQ